MHLTHLSLTNYRAFTRLDLQVPRGILVLVGDNAQGKTTLLEAIYFLATFTSFHAQFDRQLVNFTAATDPLAVTRIVAEFTRAADHHRLEVRLIQENGVNGTTRFRKEILLDGVKKTVQEALGKFTAVIFLPQMTRILEGGPDERRRFLNLALSQANPPYALALSEYAQIITQRNALLKLLNERGGDADQLGYWDDLLAQRAALLISSRITAISELERIAARIHSRLTHGAEVLRWYYQPGFDPLPQPAGQMRLSLQTPLLRDGFSPEQIRKGFTQRLQNLHAEEIARGLTTVGPHRDELRLLSNGVDLSDYGSRGQVRTALLAMKLAEAEWLQQKTGEVPVLLLDETLAELDLQRRADLLPSLRENEQTFLTTTDLSLFAAEFLGQTEIWQVAAGRAQKKVTSE